jgi:hypothetical protein
MAIFQVELDGKIIKTFEAESFGRSGDAFYFRDRNRAIVGSIIVSPGMLVTKVGHGDTEQQGR